MARALKETYRASYTPGFAQGLTTEQASLSDRLRSYIDDSVSAKQTQGSEPGNETGLVVMTERAEELSIANLDVAFQHQIHEIEAAKKQAKQPKKKKQSTSSTTTK